MANFQSANYSAHPSQLQQGISLAQVSISQLLGRDYLFIDFTDSPQPTSQDEFNRQIESIVKDLGLVENETLVVSIEQSLDGNKFSRHELVWLDGKIRRHQCTAVTQSEQHGFMQMIWQCTTPLQDF